MLNRNKPVLYCFSPAVMLFTFVVELAMAGYVTLRYRLNSTGRIGVLTLVVLGLFQFVEYQICGRGLATTEWAKAGYVAITMLPPLGLHMLQQITGHQPLRPWVGAGYMAAGAVIAALMVVPLAPACSGNYAIFKAPALYGYLYGFYYYSLLAFTLVKLQSLAGKASRSQASALKLQALGYLGFLAPTGIAVLLVPAVRQGIPSVMCGFALIYAFIVGFGIIPKVGGRLATNYRPLSLR